MVLLLVLTTGPAVRYVIEKLYEKFIVFFDIKDRMYIILVSLCLHYDINTLNYIYVVPTGQRSSVFIMPRCACAEGIR